MSKDFFKIQTSSSEVKAKIVSEYFPQYCRIILKSPLKHKQIRYIDLFAGPGVYEDNKQSTPILLAKECAEDPSLAEIVRLIFNDYEYTEQLKENFEKLIPENAFKHAPAFYSKVVGEDQSIDEFLNKDPEKTNPYPSLLFFDPFGYKGINTLILSKFLCNWGNELFLFVNTKRLSQAVNAQKFDIIMQSLFPTTIEKLRKDRKYEATPRERISLIVENLATEFVNAVALRGSKLFHCSFKFQEEDSHATSHFIIHFTKSERGFQLVKSVYHAYDNIGATLENDNNYTFDAKKLTEVSNFNFGNQNLQVLSSLILEKYNGTGKITAKALYEEHQQNTLFSWSHYLETLRYMADNGTITVTFTDKVNHKKNVFITDTCILNFN